MKLWKNKCEELSTRENEFAKQSNEMAKQSNEMEELEIQLLEYELIIEEMTEEYEDHSFKVNESEELIEQ
jgi:hypothetical protein